MHEFGVLAVRAAAGGILVVVFALVGELLTPKAFSGLFSSAPSVALASLALTIAFDGASTARSAGAGMVVGGVGMIACCVLATVAIPRVGALGGSLLAWLAWSVVALGLYWAVFIGAH